MGRKKKINIDPKQMTIGASFKLQSPPKIKFELNNDGKTNGKASSVNTQIKRKRGRPKIQSKNIKKNKVYNSTNVVNGNLEDDVEVVSQNNNIDKDESMNNNVYDVEKTPIKKKRGRPKLQANATEKNKVHNLTNGVNESLEDGVEEVDSLSNNNDKNESLNNNNNIYDMKTPIKKKRGRPKLQASATKKTKVSDLTNGVNGSSEDDIEIVPLNNNNNDKSESMNNNVYGDTKQLPSTGENLSSLPNLLEENGIIVIGVGKSSQEDKLKSNRICCKVCKEWFPNRYYLRKHILRDHEGQLYECRVCAFNSVDPDKLKTHILKVHVSKKEKVENQEKLHNNLENFPDKKFPRRFIMEDGVAVGRTVGPRVPFLCDLCNRAYTSKYSLERHVRSHTLEKPFMCDICDFSSSYREHLTRHMLAVHLIIHSNAPKEKYVPPKKEKGAKDNLDGGRKRKPIVRQRFECAVCGMRSSHKTVLAGHIRSKHPNAHIESMNSNEGFKVHLVSTAPKKAAPSKKLTLKCSHCSLIFHDNWKYKVHMRSHTGFKPFSCSVCGIKASGKMSIRDHIHRKHKGVLDAKILLKAISLDGKEENIELPVPLKKFKCEICDTEFEDNYTFKIHKTTEHPNSKPYSCEACGEKFLVKAATLLHCSSKHSDMKIEDIIRKNGKPVKIGSSVLPTCAYCKKVFPYRSQMNIHMRLHTGEALFSCEHCDYRSNVKKNLENHIKKIHLGIKFKKAGIKPINAGKGAKRRRRSSKNSNNNVIDIED